MRRVVADSVVLVIASSHRGRGRARARLAIHADDGALQRTLRADPG